MRSRLGRGGGSVSSSSRSSSSSTSKSSTSSSTSIIIIIVLTLCFSGARKVDKRVTRGVHLRRRIVGRILVAGQHMVKVACGSSVLLLVFGGQGGAEDRDVGVVEGGAPIARLPSVLRDYVKMNSRDYLRNTQHREHGRDPHICMFFTCGIGSPSAEQFLPPP